MSAGVVVDVCVYVCVSVCVYFKGVGGVVADCEKFCLLQRQCAAAIDRRQKVTSDSVWTDK